MTTSLRASPVRTVSDRIEVALLDRDGRIVAVNDAWRRFGAENGGDPERLGVGLSYLDLCDAADDAVSQQLAANIRAAVAGDLPAPVAAELPCDAPGAGRRFDVLVSSRLDDHGSCLGATVTLSPAAGRSPDQELRQRTEDLERIAADLHDDVISNLAAIGAGLEAMTPRLDGADERARVETYVEALDETIRQLQSTIFRIQTPVSASADPLKVRLLNVLDEQTIRHQLDVGIEFAGSLENDLPSAIENDLVVVVRDALRTAQLARATSVQVTVTSQPSGVVVQVSDDRPGPGHVPLTWTYLVRVTAGQASCAAS